MTFVRAYDSRTGQKLEHLVPERHIDHPVLGKHLSRTPRSKARSKAPEIDPVEPNNPEAPAAGDNEKE